MDLLMTTWSGCWIEPHSPILVPTI